MATYYGTPENSASDDGPVVVCDPAVYLFRVRHGEKPFGQIEFTLLTLSVARRFIPKSHNNRATSVSIERTALVVKFARPYRIKVTPRAPNNQSMPRTINSISITIA